LTRICGIGEAKSNKICSQLGINPETQIKHLGKLEILIRSFVEKEYKAKEFVIDEIGNNIKLKIQLGTYQGIRHQWGLPMHGQRTRTNATTQRKLGKMRAKRFNFEMIERQKR